MRLVPAAKPAPAGWRILRTQVPWQRLRGARYPLIRRRAAKPAWNRWGRKIKSAAQGQFPACRAVFPDIARRPTQPLRGRKFLVIPFPTSSCCADSGGERKKVPRVRRLVFVVVLVMFALIALLWA